MKLIQLLFISALTFTAFNSTAFSAQRSTAPVTPPLRLNSEVMAHFARALNASVYRRTLHCDPVNGQFKTVTSGLGVLPSNRISVEKNEMQLWLKTDTQKEYTVIATESASSDHDLIDLQIFSQSGQLIANNTEIYVARMDVVAALEAILGIQIHEVTEPSLITQCDRP